MDDQSVASISREIGVNENTIHKWKHELLAVNSEIDQEKLLMRKRIFELEQESVDAFYAWAVGKTYRLSAKKQKLAEKVK